MKRSCLILCLALAACEPQQAAPSASTSVTATPSASTATALPPLALDAQYKGAKLPLVSALAFSRGGRALHLTLSTHELVCSHLRQPVAKHPGEVSLDLTVAPLLVSRWPSSEAAKTTGGRPSWSVTRARFGKVTREGNLGAIELRNADPSAPVSLHLDHTLHFPPDQLVLKGDLEATGCGVLPWSGNAQLRRQPSLRASLSLGGEPLRIRGATFSEQGDGTAVLRLSSEPHPCGSIVGSDVALTIMLAADGPDAVSVRAEGYALPRTLFSKLTPGQLTATRTDDEPASDDISLQLAGQAELGDYPLWLEGRVTAQRCH